MMMQQMKESLARLQEKSSSVEEQCKGMKFFTSFHDQSSHPERQATIIEVDPAPLQVLGPAASSKHNVTEILPAKHLQLADCLTAESTLDAQYVSRYADGSFAIHQPLIAALTYLILQAKRLLLSF